jgi:hypothetical protein
MNETIFFFGKHKWKGWGERKKSRLENNFKNHKTYTISNLVIGKTKK